MVDTRPIAAIHFLSQRRKDSQMTYHRNQADYEPTSFEGNLYYVRLRTPQGIFYKLGYTNLESVESRLRYQGKGDEKYIDKVLLFMYRSNAYNIEQLLHHHFRKKRAFGKFSADPSFPLSKNGQTELYVEDVMELDEDYTPQQLKQTKRAMKLAYASKNYNDAGLAEFSVKVDEFIGRFIMPLAYLIGWTLTPLFWAIRKLTGVDQSSSITPDDGPNLKNIEANLEFLYLKQDIDKEIADEFQRKLDNIKME